MAQIRYTIVIEDGKLAGASQHTGNLDAVPLSLAELVAIVPSINAAALEAKVELETKNAALEALRSTMTEKVSAALASGDPDQFVAVALEFFDPVAAKKAELAAKRDAIEAELAALP